MLEGIVRKKGSVLIYTRTPVEGSYSTYLAYSAHFAYSGDGKNYRALNRNYGILYASATIGPRNTLREKGLKKPYLFRTAGGSFGIVAVRVNADGSDDGESKGRVLFWTSGDLVHFTEIGPANLNKNVYVREAACRYDPSSRLYVIDWEDDSGSCYRNTLTDLSGAGRMSAALPAEGFPPAVFPAPVRVPEGAVAGNALQVDGSFGDRLALSWSPLKNVSVRVPERIEAAGAEEVDAVEATAVYSDGSTAAKPVQWDVGKIDFSKPGTYGISGTVIRDEYRFPLARGFADPDVLRWNGKYYFIATNDNTGDIGLYVREADTADRLFRGETEQHLILGRDESRGLIQTFWAPEFHTIGGELYLLFAVGNKKWGPQSHVMKFKKGGEITDPESWEDPIRIRKADGAYLAADGITLDMTYLETGGGSYYIWSYREGIGTPDDTGSMLYIASIDPGSPWRLTSDPVLLARPLYGWENNEHTINNEGPYPIVTDDCVYITYSGGAAGGYTYVLGLLSCKKGDDPLDPRSWTKSCAPVLSFYSVKGEYGPGHNSFFTDGRGGVMIAYHAQESLKSHLRCTGIRRVHFNIHGAPVFDMSAERDLDAKLEHVTMKVTVKA